MNDNKQRVVITTDSWLRGVVVIAVAYALYLISSFVLVIIAAIVIASAIEPATVWAKKQGIPRLPMALLIYISSAIILSGLFYFLLLPLIGDMASFIKTLSIYSNSLTGGGVISDMFRSQNLFGNLDTPVLIRQLSSHLNALANFLSQGVFSSASIVFGGVLNFILILVLSFYLVVEEDGVSKFLKTITPLKHEPYVINLWRRSQHKIGLWMQGQLLASFFVMVLVYLTLVIMGIPHSLLLAVLAGVLELIPLFGATIAAVPAIFIAFVSDGMTTAFIIAALYILIQQIESNVIYPIVVKKVVGVPPIISIIALVVGGSLAGFLGVVIAVPVAAAIIEFTSDLEERKIAAIEHQS